MYQHVPLELVPAVEGGLAEGTVKRLLPGVDQLVELKGIFRLEFLGAFLQKRNDHHYQGKSPIYLTKGMVKNHTIAKEPPPCLIHLTIYFLTIGDV